MFNQSKYTKWYFSITDKAKSRTILDYAENHHIIPRSLGGDNNKNNIVRLTAREHFICHLLLTKMLEGRKKRSMIYALHMLSHAKNKHHKRYIPRSSKLYAYERRLFAESHSKNMKKNHPLKNPIHKQAHQLGVERRGPTSVKGAKRSESMKEKMRNRKWSQKAVDNRLKNCLTAAKARKGSKWNNKRHELKFQQYKEKNKHIFPQVFLLAETGMNTRQISLKLHISWDRVNYILQNKHKLNTI